MSSRNLLALYGLKWNPFSPELPGEALLATPKIEHFAWRVEQLVQRGDSRSSRVSRAPVNRWRCGSSPGGCLRCATSRSV